MSDHFEHFLDKALADYSKAPERIGLEQRIVARLHERRKFRFNWSRLAVAFASLVVVIAAMLLWTGHQSRPQQLATVSMSKPPAVEPVAPPVNGAIEPVRSLRYHHKVAAPKLHRFPAPSPLTDEERALLQLASLDPKYVPVELTHPDQPIKSIELAPINVEPISKEE